MRVDPVTFLVSDIDAATREDMLRVCKAMTLEGALPNPHPAWMTQWLTETKQGENPHKLLIAAVAMPIRILLSLLLEPDPGPSEAVRNTWQRDYAALYTKFCTLKNLATDYRVEMEKRHPTLGPNEDTKATYDLDVFLDGET